MRDPLTVAFRPKADANRLYELNEAVWRRKSREVWESKIGDTGEQLARHLESIYSAADMPLLAQYGCTQHKEEVYVRVRVPDADRWDETVSVPLGRPVTVPSSYSGLYCGGPRFSEWPNRGVTKEYQQESRAAGKWDSFCADQERRDREAVPVALEPFFFAVIDIRKAWKRDYKRVTAWPSEFKARKGRYPTWGEIAAEFPLIAEELARESEEACVAA